MGTSRPTLLDFMEMIRSPPLPNPWRFTPIPSKSPPRYSPYSLPIPRLQRMVASKLPANTATTSNNLLITAPPTRIPVPQTRSNVRQLHLAAQITEFESVLRQVTGGTGPGIGPIPIQGQLGNPAFNYMRPILSRAPPVTSSTTSSSTSDRRNEEDLILKIRQEIEKEARRFETARGNNSTAARPRETVGHMGGGGRDIPTFKKKTQDSNIKSKTTPLHQPGAEEGSECVICLEEKKSHILIPCGHYSYCEGCAKSLKNCALCRKKITKRVKVFES